MRFGGPLFTDVEDPEILAAMHRTRGYSAAYCPEGLNITDTDKIRKCRKAFDKNDVVIAEVGAWRNILDQKKEIAEENIRYVEERLALADELGALCCVNLAGSYSTDNWYGPHPANYLEEAFESVVSISRRIIDAVKPKFTKLSYEIMQYNFLDSPEAYLKLLQAIDRKQMGVHLDPVNCVVSPRIYYNNKELLNRCLNLLGPYIVSCHAKDVLIRPEPLSVQFDEVRPGVGIMDYGVYLKGLSRLPKDVPLMMEHLADENEYAIAGKYIKDKAAALGLRFQQKKEVS